MKKILFYCQYLTGMGHLVRSTEIIRNLVADFQVCFVNGGPPVSSFEIPPEVQLVTLPPLWIEKGQLQVAHGFKDIEDVKNHRKNTLIQLFEEFQADCLITEFFPFGRHKLGFELIPLLDHIKAVAPQTKIVSSVRDIIGRSDLESEEETICQLINQYFDLILFHSDRNFQKLEESFTSVEKLQCPVEYTGFVAQSKIKSLNPKDLNLITTNPLILVSIGGGRIGYELLESIIKVGPILKNKIPHTIQIFTGPFLPEEQFRLLEAGAEKQSNIKLQRYTPDLMAYMEKAELSISLSGYNTTMNILSTGVNSLVVPIGHYNKDQEQLIRTQKLERMGIVEVIDPQNLNLDFLAQKIISCLNKNHSQSPNHLFDLNGAPKTAALLKNLLLKPQWELGEQLQALSYSQ